MPTWFTTLTPFVLALLTWTLGFWAWRYQLRAKRRTELAEEALLAFAQAVDALANVRAPMRWSNELEALRKERDKDPQKPMPGEDFLVVFRRYREQQDKFTALRRLHLLCRYHFGDAAGRAFDQLREAVHEVTVAAHMGATTPESEVTSPEDRAMRREWRNTIWAGSSRPDLIAEKVGAAQRDLEAILTPHLRADAALLPIAVGWRSGKARAVALIQRGNSSKPTKAPD
ncbi:hypothetical protein [Roseococcus thiosulfatophilus]|uniref:hypothetical protein n=1 Tax=Roseococcus thiosulfatophilus TaxID=35813 RepID=UPI001A8DE31C|nr:hypothetical protein [Roseococcus thiosulfatophilus]